MSLECVDSKYYRMILSIVFTAAACGTSNHSNPKAPTFQDSSSASQDSLAETSLTVNNDASVQSNDREPESMSGITTAHNQARASVTPAAATLIPNLTWSSRLAEYAQNWANQCTFTHSQGQYGENIFATTNATTPEQVVANWNAEKANYTYESNRCNGVCGHYTQTVWATTRHLGCGMKKCSQNSPFDVSRFGPNWQFWVCSYDPAGNVVNDRPYCAIGYSFGCAK